MIEHACAPARRRHRNPFPREKIFHVRSPVSSPIRNAPHRLLTPPRMQELGGKKICREVEVVKGKVSSRCFWNACKALSFGLLLMFIGTTMATLGYYADQLSVVQEMRGNTTVRIKHEARGFHLNNLSYAGPIVMGVGGFIVVAACVMTFEARDSAAKVVPTPRARQLSSYPTRNKSGRLHQGSVRSGGDSRRSTSCQTKWEGQGRASPAPSDQISRRALTAAFVQFSRELGSRPQPAGLNKSPSAPDLVAQPPPKPPSCALLSPHYLLQRQALSVDNQDYGSHFSPPGRIGSRQSLELAPAVKGSQGSMAMDLHLECPVTLRVRDRTRRMDSRRLVRQRPVENDDYDTHSWSPRYCTQEEEIMMVSRSMPHSRRESVARTPSQGSTENRSRANSGESIKRRRSRERVSQRMLSSRSASDRSDRASPLEEQHDIVVIEPEL